MRNVEVTLKVADSIEFLRTLPDNSLDSCVTDPPYGLTSKPPKIEEVLTAWLQGDRYLVKKNGFMNSSWDSLVPGPELWKEVYRVLKPGAYLSAFFSPRTADIGGIAIRMAGFEIRDQIAWLRKGGMPKSTNVGLMVDKHLKVTGNRGAAFTVAGVDTQASMEGKAGAVGAYNPEGTPGSEFSHMGTGLKPSQEPIIIARKPLDGGKLATNALTWGTGGMDVVSTRFGSDKTTVNTHSGGPKPFGDAAGKEYASKTVEGKWPGNAILEDGYEAGWLNGRGDLAQFFLVPKASKKEKEAGCDGLPAGRGGRKNPHPSPKPIDLMRHLVRLLTPENGTVLDPFNGSGGTALGAVLEGRDYIGVDLSSEYLEITKARLAHWADNFSLTE